MNLSNIMQSVRDNRRLQTTMRWAHLGPRQMFGLALLIFSITSLVMDTTISAQLNQCRTYYYIFGTITAGSNLLWGPFSFIQDGKKKILNEDIERLKELSVPSLDELLHSLRSQRAELDHDKRDHDKRDHDIAAILVVMTLFAMVFAGVNLTFYENEEKKIVNWRAWVCVALDGFCLLCDDYFFCFEKGLKVRKAPAAPAQDEEARRQVDENQGALALDDLSRDES
ncbi:hypothetical protein BDZ45DRAFT_696552 [Acephala macrosclerotiorum]|nr:hypothetical protein BDZ45DRAFT_696552 [Acephala macrosclerotiorum]